MSFESQLYMRLPVLISSNLGLISHRLTTIARNGLQRCHSCRSRYGQFSVAIKTHILLPPFFMQPTIWKFFPWSRWLQFCML